MVLFNYSTKEITAKIVYYGPGLCGKTTNLQFIYDSLPQTINKGKMLSLATKTDRTLFFDFLPIDLGTIRGMRTRLQLYTVPGQVFYNTTRKLVLKGADGVVFVADSQKQMLDANLESFGNLEENLAEHDMKLSDIPMILQFNKRDLPDVASIEDLNTAMNKFNAPIYEAVAPTGIGVHETLKAITRLVLNSLKERYADKREQKTDAQAKASAAMAAASIKTSPAEARASKPTATPMPEMTYKTSEPPAPRPMVQAAADSRVAASVPSAVPKPMASPMASNPPMTHSQSDSEPLSFELPEMDELTDSGTMPAGSSDFSSDPMASESGIAPELMNDDPSPTELMPAISADLGIEDDLLELAPESELAIDAGGDELLELADEPLADLAHLEDSISMPVLDVTSEMAFEDGAEPMASAIEPGISDVPMTASTLTPDEFESTAIDNSAQLESMLQQDTPIQISPGVDDGFDEAFFEPIETGTVVTEDHHDTSLHVTDMNSVSSIAPIPLALDSGAETHREENGAFEASITPRIPVSDFASRPMGAAGIARTPGMASEINLPVKLEIGGRCISFELKISLDLTEISAHAVSESKEMHGARS